MNTSVLLLYLVEWLGVIGATMLMGLAPAFQRARLGFRYPRREGTVSFLLFAIFFLIAFQYYRAAGSLPLLPEPVKEDTLPLLLSGLRSQAIVAAVGLGLVLLALAIRRQPLRSAGWNRETLGAALRLGIGTALVVLFLRGRAMNVMDGLTPGEGTAFLYWAVIALGEETLFRGYIQPRMAAWLGERWGWLAASAMFTLWFLPGRLGVYSGSVLLWGLLISAVQGLLLGWMMRKTGHAAAPFFYRLISGWIQTLI